MIMWFLIGGKCFWVAGNYAGTACQRHKIAISCILAFPFCIATAYIAFLCTQFQQNANYTASTKARKNISEPHTYRAIEGWFPQIALAIYNVKGRARAQNTYWPFPG
jgi:hypothetical protein